MPCCFSFTHKKACLNLRGSATRRTRAPRLRRYGTRTPPSLLMGTMANRAETPGDTAARYRAMAAAARRRARSSDWTTRLLLLQVAEKYMAMARNAVEGAKRGVRSSGHG